jgi:hypothetical protein
MLAEQVALAAHGLDPRRVFRVVAEFAAQPRNARVDRAVEAVEADAAQFLQQVVARQDAAGVAGEQPEQVEFGGGQVDRVAAEMRAARRLADAEAAESEFVRLAGFAAVAGVAPPGGGGERRSRALMRASRRRGCTGLAI